MARQPCCTNDYGPFINWLLVALRLAVGIAMLTHGVPKLIKLFYGDFGFPDPIGIGPELSLVLATFAEFFCSILIIVGYRSRFAAIPLIFTMLVALLVLHANDSVLEHWNILLYLFAYAILLHLGGGKYTLTYYFFEKEKKKNIANQ